MSTARINDRLIHAADECERSQVVAVASRDRRRAARYAEQRGIPAAYGSYSELLRDPDVDAIYISLPNWQHAEMAYEAARHHKHVLVEKPIATAVGDVQRLEAAAADNNVVIQEASMMRFHPQTALLRELVHGGAIGAPRWLRASFGFTLRNPDDIRLRNPGGGSVWDLGCYPVTLFQTVLQRPPLEVAGFAHFVADRVDMTFAAQIRYEGEVFGQFVTSMEAVPSWSAEFAGSDGYIRVTYPWLSHIDVDSTVEVVHRPVASSPSAFGDGTDDLVTERHVFAHVNAYVTEVAAMEAMVLDGVGATFPLEESTINVATICALLQSTESTAWVKVRI